MNSREWQRQIDDTTAAIDAKTARLMMMGHTKAEAISDHKKLLALEQEEVRIPVDIEILRRRLPLLNDALEGALKDEAQVRLLELQLQGAEAANQVSATTQAIHSAMGELLARIAEARDVWNAHDALVAEQRFLEVRFVLPARKISVGDRLGGDERGRFLRQCEKSLQHNVPMTAWDRSRVDFLERQRGKAEQQRADAGRTVGPQHIHYADHADFQADEQRQEKRRSAEAANHEPISQYVHWSDNVTTGRSH